MADTFRKWIRLSYSTLSLGLKKPLAFNATIQGTHNVCSSVFMLKAITNKNEEFPTDLLRKIWFYKWQAAFKFLI